MTETLTVVEKEMKEEFLENSNAEAEAIAARDLIRKVEIEKDKKCGDEINAVLTKYNRFFDVTFSYEPSGGLKKTIILLKKQQ